MVIPLTIVWNCITFKQIWIISNRTIFFLGAKFLFWWVDFQTGSVHHLTIYRMRRKWKGKKWDRNIQDHCQLFWIYSGGTQFSCREVQVSDGPNMYLYERRLLFAYMESSNRAYPGLSKTSYEQHQKPPWRDLVFGFMWGTPRESQTFTRESRAKAPRKECVKVEPRKQWRKQVDSRSTFKYTCAPSFTGNFPRKQPRKILRNTCRRESQNCARERTAKAVAKAYKD